MKTNTQLVRQNSKLNHISQAKRCNTVVGMCTLVSKNTNNQAELNRVCFIVVDCEVRMAQ